MKKTFRKKLKIKKNSKIYKGLSTGVFSPSVIQKQVKKATKALASMVARGNVKKSELEQGLRKIGIKPALSAELIGIAEQKIDFYKKKLQDNDWQFSAKETQRKAVNSIATSWSIEVSGVALQEFVAIYSGYRAKWGVSTSKHPRFEHMPFYGEEFIVGVGVKADFSKKDLAVDLGSKGLHPGQEWGCHCIIIIISDSPIMSL